MGYKIIITWGWSWGAAQFTVTYVMSKHIKIIQVRSRSMICLASMSSMGKGEDLTSCKRSWRARRVAWPILSHAVVSPWSCNGKRNVSSFTIQVVIQVKCCFTLKYTRTMIAWTRVISPPHSPTALERRLWAWLMRLAYMFLRKNLDDTASIELSKRGDASCTLLNVWYPLSSTVTNGLRCVINSLKRNSASVKLSIPVDQLRPKHSERET